MSVFKFLFGWFLMALFIGAGVWATTFFPTGPDWAALSIVVGFVSGALGVGAAIGVWTSDD